jgi:hypothetical protein
MFRREEKMKNNLYQIAFVLALCWLVTAGGCAGKGTAPDEQIANTEKAISEAKYGNATVHAPLELKLADEKLKAAKAATDKKEYEQARRLLEEARVDAELAEAKSASVKARQVAKEMSDSIETLRQEIERSQRAQ